MNAETQWILHDITDEGINDMLRGDVKGRKVDREETGRRIWSGLVGMFLADR